MPEPSSGSSWSSLSHRWAAEAASRLACRENCLVDDLAQFSEHGLLIIAMTPTVEQSRATADKTLVFVRPLNNLHVLITCAHCGASRMAGLTAFSWYAFASPPSGPASVTGLTTFGWTKFRWLPPPPRLTNPAASRSLISSLTSRGMELAMLFLVGAIATGWRVKERSHPDNHGTCGCRRPLMSSLLRQPAQNAHPSAAIVAWPPAVATTAQS